jgi:hypothetical protein
MVEVVAVTPMVVVDRLVVQVVTVVAAWVMVVLRVATVVRVVKGLTVETVTVLAQLLVGVVAVREVLVREQTRVAVAVVR